jgi:hypothetical protein
MNQVAADLQPKLLAFRLQNFHAVKNFRTTSELLQRISPRAKQVARALIQPLLGNVEISSELISILTEQDEEGQTERSLEPEWLVAEIAFGLAHQGIETGHLIAEILIGGVAAEVNHKLQIRGEGFSLSARKVGATLKSLGIRSEKLGRLGRGLRFGSALRRKIHEIARQMGINRRNIASLTALEHGYGGPPCPLCEEFGTTGGLKFVEIQRSPQRKEFTSRRGRLFTIRDDVRSVPDAGPKKSVGL